MAVAILTVRVIAGILFFFQGYDKVFNVGIGQVRQTMNSSMAGRNIPEFLVTFTAGFSSYVELIGGFLLIIGFFKFFAAYFLCFSLVLVSIGFSIIKPMWDSFHLVFRLALLIFILITPLEWAIISFDHLFRMSGLLSP